jgi:thiamine-phosphate pyrophosphorylase
MSANETNTRLYLNIPIDAMDQLDTPRQLLDRLTTSLDVACVNLLFANKATGKAPSGNENLQGLVKDLQQKNIAVLADLTDPFYLEDRKSFEKALENSVNLKCDGIHMNAEIVLFERAREVLHKDAIIGCDCGTSKHLAMQLGEQGADYVAFRSSCTPSETPDNPDQLVELIGWWQELFEVPCVAADIVDQLQIEALLEIPADFIAIGSKAFETLDSDDALLTWLMKKCPLPEKAS